MGLGLLSGRAAPPFLFSWGGAPARVIGRRAGARPSAWWGGAGECGRAFVCVRAGRGARVIGWGWCARTWRVGDRRQRVVGGYAYPVGLTPVFGDSLCGF